MCALSSAEAPLYRREAGEREKSDVRKIFLLFGRRPNRVIEIACFDWKLQ